MRIEQPYGQELYGQNMNMFRASLVRQSSSSSISSGISQAGLPAALPQPNLALAALPDDILNTVTTHLPYRDVLNLGNTASAMKVFSSGALRHRFNSIRHTVLLEKSRLEARDAHPVIIDAYAEIGRIFERYDSYQNRIVQPEGSAPLKEKRFYRILDFLDNLDLEKLKNVEAGTLSLDPAVQQEAHRQIAMLHGFLEEPWFFRVPEGTPDERRLEAVTLFLDDRFIDTGNENVLEDIVWEVFRKVYVVPLVRSDGNGE